MKKYFGIILVICCIALCVSCGNNQQQNKSIDQYEQSVVACDEPIVNGVFVCNGKYAKRYHRTQNCSGLSNCQGGITKMTVEQAESKGLTPCKKCY